MKQHPLSFLGTTRTERHKAIAGVSDAITAAGGWIVDHALFSNTAITIRFVLPRRGLRGRETRRCEARQCSAGGRRFWR
jgi:hypothetical protein